MQTQIEVKQVKELLIDAFELEMEVDEIEDELELFGSGLELDSIDVLEIYMQSEAKFGIKIPQDQKDYDFLKNVTTLTNYLNKLNSNKEQ